MPQHGMIYEGRRRGTRRNTCKASGQVDSQVPGSGLVNGAVVHSGCPSAATRTNERAPAGTLTGTKPQCMVNGYINHGFTGKSPKAQPPRTHREQRSVISAVTDASAAGRGCSAAVPGGTSASGATRLDTVALSCTSDQITPEPSRSEATKKQRRRRNFGRKKRPPMMPPKEEEDWEKEIQEVNLNAWENTQFGFKPYDPEDLLHFSSLGLTLKQRDTVDLPVTASYSPSIHHPRPVPWSRYKIRTEPGQFSDADE